MQTYSECIFRRIFLTSIQSASDCDEIAINMQFAYSLINIGHAVMLNSAIEHLEALLS